MKKGIHTHCHRQAWAGVGCGHIRGKCLSFEEVSPHENLLPLVRQLQGGWSTWVLKSVESNTKVSQFGR